MHRTFIDKKHISQEPSISQYNMMNYFVNTLVSHTSSHHVHSFQKWMQKCLNSSHVLVANIMDYECVTFITVWMCRCQMVSTEDGDVPVCMGDPDVGNACDDYNECSVDDKCVAVTPVFSFNTGASCRGVLATGQSCNDYNVCTDDDVCGEFPYTTDYGFPLSFDTFFGCEGKLVAGRPCDDNDVCTSNDVCRESEFSAGSCEGTPAAGAACNDFNQCTTADTCVLTPDGNNSFCEGTPTVGAPCDDDDVCSANDTCISRTSPDGLFVGFACIGTPVSGNPCDDLDECTTDDVCVPGVSDYGEFAFCRGAPTAGAPCNDGNPCTVGDVCVLVDGSFAFCQAGKPTPSEECDEYNESAPEY
jgi:hypothetical protein